MYEGYDYHVPEASLLYDDISNNPIGQYYDLDKCKQCKNIFLTSILKSPGGSATICHYIHAQQCCVVPSRQCQDVPQFIARVLLTLSVVTTYFHNFPFSQ